MGGGHTFIHIADAAGTVVGTGGAEVDLQVTDRLQHGTHLHVVVVVDGGRRGGDIIVGEQPAVVVGLVDKTVADESEGEVKTRGEDAALVLTEEVADIGDVAGQVHRILVAETDVHAAHHHQQSGCRLGGLVPPLVLKRFLGHDAEHNLDGIEVLDEDLVLVDHFVFHLVGLAFLRAGGDDDTLGVLIMGHDGSGVGLEGDLTLVAVLELRQGLFV